MPGMVKTPGIQGRSMLTKSVQKNPMRGDCMICMAMSGNGVRIYMIKMVIADIPVKILY